jgi:hypothetical protein
MRGLDVLGETYHLFPKESNGNYIPRQQRRPASSCARYTNCRSFLDVPRRATPIRVRVASTDRCPSAPGGRVSSPPTRLRGASIRCPSSHRNFVVTRSRHQINDVVLGRRRDLGNVVSKRFGMRNDYVLRRHVGPNTSVDLSSPPVSSCESLPKLTPRSKVVVSQWSQIIPEILDLW